jgi:hypothetical protein
MDNVFYDKYFETLFNRIRLMYDVDDEQEKLIRKNILAKAERIPINIENNYKNSEINSNTEEILNLFYSKKPSISGYGVLFKNKAVNAPGLILSRLISLRKSVKKEMFKYQKENNALMFFLKNIEQKVIKVLANAFYGALGQSSFHFYNPVLGPSVTYTGQNVILSAILGFEAFVAGNFELFDFDELLQYIDNINSEELLELSIMDEQIEKDTVYEWLKSHCAFKMSDTQEDLLNNILDRMNDYALERLYLKNNIYEIIDTEIISDIFKNCYDPEFVNPGEPTEKNKESLEILNEYFTYFLAYPYQWINKFERVFSMSRKCVIISDTDSTFLNLNPIVEWFEKKFNDNEKLENKERLAICNITTYTLTKYVEKVFWILTGNMNVPEERRPLINMKNEFHYSRIMLTKNKKHYAGLMVAQEGNVFDKPEFDIKGLDIKTVKTPKIARKYFGDLLANDILLTKEIKPMQVFKRFVEFERAIHKSLVIDGKTSFLKPSKFASAKRYKKPGTMQVYRGVVLWNMLFPKQFIPNFSNVNLLRLRRVDRENYKELFPSEHHDTIEKYFDSEIEINDPESKALAEKASKTTFGDYGISVIAIPKNVENVPEMLRSLIDVTFVIDANMKNGNILLESIGFKVIKSLKQGSYSNIIEV